MIKQNNDFRYDLKVGQEGETFLSQLLRDGKDHYTVEVKLDTQAHRTGNLYFEYESRGKNSGLQTTESDFYAIMTSNKSFCLIVKTALLKDALRNWHNRCVRENRNADMTWRKKGGDNGTSTGMLIPITELILAVRLEMM